MAVGLGSPTLVIHPGALGDVLLAVPALRALRRMRPAGRLVLAAEPRLGALLAALGVVDDHVRFDALGLDALFCSGGREAGADGGWPESGAPRLRDSAHVVSWFGARDPDFAARLRVLVPGAVIAPSVAGDRPVWEHLLTTVGGTPTDGPAVTVPSSLIGDGHRALRAAGWGGDTPVIMVHPGAGGVAKRWPAEGFARALTAVVASRGLTLVVHQGPADVDAVAELLARYRGPLIRLVDPPLPLLAGALTRVTAWLGNDSGVSHLAAAVGVRSLVLFRRSNLAWRPWSASARSLTVETSEPRPADLDAVIAGIAALLG